MTNNKNKFGECKICYGEDKELICLHDDKHLCCKPCALEILNDNKPLSCPFCREKIISHQDEDINDLIKSNELNYNNYNEIFNFNNSYYNFNFNNYNFNNSYYNYNFRYCNIYCSDYIIYIMIDYNNLKKDIFQKYKNPRKSYKPVGGKCVKFRYI